MLQRSRIIWTSIKPRALSVTRTSTSKQLLCRLMGTSAVGGLMGKISYDKYTKFQVREAELEAERKSYSHFVKFYLTKESMYTPSYVTKNAFPLLSPEKLNEILYNDKPSSEQVLKRLQETFYNSHELGLKALSSLSSKQARDIACDLESLELLVGMKFNRFVPPGIDDDEVLNDLLPIPQVARQDLIKRIGVEHFLKLMEKEPHSVNRQKLLNFLAEAVDMKKDEVVKLFAELSPQQTKPNNSAEEQQEQTNKRKLN